VCVHCRPSAHTVLTAPGEQKKAKKSAKGKGRAYDTDSDFGNSEEDDYSERAATCQRHTSSRLASAQ
jgi:hypothetical protein